MDANCSVCELERTGNKPEIPTFRNSENDIHVNGMFVGKGISTLRAKYNATRTPGGPDGTRNSAIYKQISQTCFAISGNQLTDNLQPCGIERQTNFLKLSFHFL